MVVSSLQKHTQAIINGRKLAAPKNPPLNQWIGHSPQPLPLSKPKHVHAAKSPSTKILTMTPPTLPQTDQSSTSISRKPHSQKTQNPTATTRPKLRGIPTPNRHSKAPPMSQPLKNQLWGKSWG